MRKRVAIACLMALPGLAAAETVQSGDMEAEITRKPVAMKSQNGGTIAAQQAYVAVRHSGGQPVAASELRAMVPFAEQAACRGRTVLVSLILGVAGDAGRYEVLCAGGG